MSIPSPGGGPPALYIYCSSGQAWPLIVMQSCISYKKKVNIGYSTINR